MVQLPCHEASEWNPASCSSTLPPPPDAEIDRTPAIVQLYSMLSRQRPVVIVEGPPSSGKTVLLSQLVRRYCDRTVSFFIGSDFWTTRPWNFLLSCCQQMQQVVRKFADIVLDDADQSVLVEWFGKLYHAVAKEGRRNNRPFIFVVDGLDRLSDSFAQPSILSLLPVNPLDGTFFVGSCTPGVKLPFTHETLPMPLLSQLETERYFSGLLKPQDAAQIYRLSSGLPGYLAHIRRQVQTGTSPEEILSDPAHSLSQLYDRDWTRTESMGGATMDALALVAFSPEDLTVRTVSSLVDTDEPATRKLLSEVPFVTIDPSSDVVRFRSDSHRHFVSERLESRRGQAEDRLIRSYEKDPKSPGAVVHLSTLYRKAKKYDKLRNLVGTDYVLRSLTEGDDFGFQSSREALRLLGEAAHEVKDWTALAFACMADSILGAVSGEMSPLESKVKALLARKKYEDGLTLSFAARLPADRLHMLSHVCRALHEEHLPISDDITETVEQTLQRVEVTPELHRKLFDTAANIFPAMPSLAIRILQRIAHDDLGAPQGHLIDILVTSLLVYCGSHGGAAAAELEGYIKDETLRDFTRAASPLMARLSADEVLSEAESISDTSARLFLLRSWCNANKKNPQTHLVVERALSLLSESTDYTPSMRDLRQIAEPLVYWPTQYSTEELVRRIDMIRDTIVASPADEAARLNLVLARVENSWSEETGTSRLYDVYLSSLDSIPDPGIRSFALVHVLLTLRHVCPTDAALRKEVTEALQSSFDQFLSDSAEQFRLCRRVIRALTSYDPSLAVAFASRLNTSSRRDEAYEEVLRAYIARDGAALDAGFIKKTLEAIEDVVTREAVLVKALRSMERTASPPKVDDEEALCSLVGELSDPAARAYAAAYYLAGPGKTNPVSGDKMTEILRSAIRAIGEPSRRVMAGFSLCSVVASVAPHLSQELFDWASDEELRTSLVNPSLANLHSAMCKLAIRGIPDACRGEQASGVVDQVVSLADRASSPLTRCMLLAALGLRLHTSGNEREFNKVARRCLEILDSVQDPTVARKMLVDMAPVLYEFERGLLEERLSGYPSSIQDSAYFAVFRYVLSQRSSIDPVSLEELRCPPGTLDSRDLRRACDVIAKMSRDQAICGSIGFLVEKITSKESRGKVACEVRERDALFIASRLTEVVAAKLPDRMNIRHEGYAIAARAYLARLREAALRTHSFRATVQWNKLAIPSWDALVKAARGIPNTADRALVLTIIGEACHHDPSVAKSILDQAATQVNEIKNDVDRLERFCSLAKAYNTVSQVEAAKYVIDQTLPILRGMANDEGMNEIMERVISIAHSIDPDFGAAIASRMDNPVIKAYAEDELRSWQLRRNPADLSKQDGDLGWVIRLACSRILTSFCSRNGTIQSATVVGDWLRAAFRRGFSTSELAVSWFIENAVASSEGRQTPQLSELLQRILSLGELLLHVDATVRVPVASATASSAMVPSLKPVTNVRIVRAGDRGEALGILHAWLLEHGAQYAKIYDPHFGVRELELLKSIPGQSFVQIVTSWRGQRHVGVFASAEEIRDQYRRAWRSISAQVPPTTIVYVVGDPDTGDSPMHDRYIIGADAGLELGTSINGLGLKDSVIRYLDRQEKEVPERKLVDPIICNQPLDYKGKRVGLCIFSL